MTSAIIMASGMGTRMRPLTLTTPKPLIKVCGTPMVETVIQALQNKDVENIVVVVGYLGEQFEYLTQKYKNVTLVKNNVYEKINNVSSVYFARENLLKGDCFICEADLYVANSAIFNFEHKNSCYYGKMVKGHSDDWVFEQDDKGVITRVGKVGDDCYNMTGIAYFTSEDAKKLYDFITAEYGATGYENLFWDDVVNKYIKEFALTVHPIKNDEIIEIDTVCELEEVNKRFCKQ